MNKFNSRARYRFVSMRKRRAFGPRRSPWAVMIWGSTAGELRRMPSEMARELLREGQIGHIEGFRFIESPTIHGQNETVLPGEQSGLS